MATKKKAAPKKAAARKPAPKKKVAAKKKAATRRAPPVAPAVEAEDDTKRGRPTKYDPKFDVIAYKLCLLGATDKDMAEAFNVCEDTINEWKHAHPSFAEQMTGKRIANAEMAHSLYQRGRGYEHEAVQFFCHNGIIIEQRYTKKYPPDTTAASLFLRNREPELWRDKQDHEHFGPKGGPIPVAQHNVKLDDLTDEEAAKAYLDLIKRSR